MGWGRLGNSAGGQHSPEDVCSHRKEKSARTPGGCEQVSRRTETETEMERKAGGADGETARAAECGQGRVPELQAPVASCVPAPCSPCVKVVLLPFAVGASGFGLEPAPTLPIPEGSAKLLLPAGGDTDA